MGKKKTNSVRKSLEAERLRQIKIQEDEEAERKVQEENQRKIEMERNMEIQNKLAQSLVELGNLEEIKNHFEGENKIEEKKQFDKYKWEKYIRCDGNINPLSMRQINTFLSLWLEHGSNKMDDIMKNCEKIIIMLEELNYAKKFTQYDQEIDFDFLQEIETKLLFSMYKKIDMGTLSILENAVGGDVDFDTGNLHLMDRIDQIVFCLWVNLSKGLKTTNHQFDVFDFTFDIPKTVQSADVAIRLIWESFDSLTPISESYKVRKISKRLNNVTVVQSILVNNDNNGLSKRRSTNSQLEIENLVETQDVPKPESEPTENIDDVESEEDVSEMGEFELDVDFVDMRCYRTIGGLFHLEILNLPLQPIKINRDLILTLAVDDCHLRKFNYSTEDSTDNPEYFDETDKIAFYGSPIRINFKFPSNFLITEQPDIAFWDTQERNWRTDIAFDPLYDENLRVMSFSAKTLGTFALVQELHIHMPYQSWEIRPRANNHVLITMMTSIAEFEIEIKDDLLCLSSVQEYHELDLLLGKWMPFEIFVQTLYDAGLNIFPKEDSNYFLKMNKKTKKLSRKVYLDISVTSPVMAFAYSHFNEQTDKNTCILQIAKPTGDEPINENNWIVTTNSTKYVQCLKVSEFEAELNFEPLNNQDKFHSTLYQMSCDKMDVVYTPTDNWKLCKTLESFITKVDFLNYSV